MERKNENTAAAAPPLPPSRVPRRIAIAAALAAGGVAAALLAPLGLAWVFTHPPRRPHRKTPRAALGLAFRRVRLVARDGVRLSAWYVPTAGSSPPPPRGLVVVCHGYYGNRGEMLPHLAFLHAAGYAVLLLDFRAHGWSGGRMATFGLSEIWDVQAALDWSESQPELAGLPIALLGESMGAAVCLLVAAGDARVKAVVADSAFARFDNAIAGRLRLLVGPHLAPRVVPPVQSVGERLLGTRSQDISPEQAIGKIAPRPVLLIHGAADRLITPENAHRLLAAAAGRGTTTLWIVPGAGHVQAARIVPTEYARRVSAFLDAALANGGPLRDR